MSAFDLVLRNAQLENAALLVDVGIQGDRITQIAPKLEGQSANELDLGGRLLASGFVDVHTHLDKNLTIDRIANESGTLLEAIESWVAFKPNLTLDDYVARASRGVEMALAQGTTSMRSHVDVDANGLTALEALLTVRETYRDAITLEITALGGPGLGGAEFQAMVDALEMGADVVGGCPAIRPDGHAEIIEALELAQRFGKRVDLHVDENENPDSRWLEVLADETIKRGLEGQVTAGHCCSLAFMPDDVADRVMDKVVHARINIVSLPACNLNLQGRGMRPAPRGLTRVRELLERGVNVCVGSDNVQDPFQPIGNYDLLSMANLTAMAAHMTGAAQIAESFEMISTRPARAMNLERGVRVGAVADLVIVNASSKLEAVRGVAPRLMVFKAGKPVSGSRVLQTVRGREVLSWTS